MRRLIAIVASLAVASAAVAAGAGADDTRTYRIELDNAFGLVEGAQVRVAGVNVGTVTDLSINAEKRAEVEVEVSGDLAQLGEETRCSTEPQSLIAEYFIDCAPAGEPLPDGGLIPVEQTKQTVQLDLVQATFREPLRRRLALFVNEFGAALAGNGENLNEAIRRGAPALGELDQLLARLAGRNRTFKRMVVDGEQVLSRLAARREEITRFIGEAKDVAEAAAERRGDLSRDVELLDDLLVELRPALVELGNVSRAQAPLLASLSRSAGELERLGVQFPAFAGATETGLDALGGASVAGERAISSGRDEIAELARATRKAPATTEPLKDLVRDLDDPDRAVEIDQRAARSCDDPTRSCWATGRPAPTGYTGLEALFNYAYYLAGATNQVDQLGHLLHVNIYSVGDIGNPCGGTYWTGGEPGAAGFGVPAEGGGLTTNLLDAASCVSWLGPNQPGLNQDLGLPPYDPSVCPDGSEAPDLCDPAGPERAPASAEQANAGGGRGGRGEDGADDAEQPPAPPAEEAPDSDSPAPPGSEQLPPGLLDQLLDDLPGGLGETLPEGLGLGGAQSGGGAPNPDAVEDLLEFLIGGSP